MKAEIHTQYRGYISQYNFRTSEKVSKIPEPTHHFMTKALRYGVMHVSKGTLMSSLCCFMPFAMKSLPRAATWQDAERKRWQMIPPSNWLVTVTRLKMQRNIWAAARPVKETLSQWNVYYICVSSWQPVYTAWRNTLSPCRPTSVWSAMIAHGQK